MNGCELVVFDLAGTTVRDDGHIGTALTATLAEQGVTVTERQLADVRGASKREVIAQLIPDGPDRARRSDAAFALFRDRLIDAYRTNGVAEIPGARSVFRQLRAAGIRVALTTGFDREVTRLLLTALGWHHGVADAVVCGDDVREGRPAPHLIFHAMTATGVACADRVAAVGDTTNDLVAGHRAGVRWNIGVLSGAHSRAQLRQAPHTHLLASVIDLGTTGACAPLKVLS
jgi:phosphonatase-like hydrolase